MADRRLKDKGARRSDNRECVKCGHMHRYNSDGGVPFLVRFEAERDQLVYTCPTCGYVFSEPTMDANTDKDSTDVETRNRAIDECIRAVASGPFKTIQCARAAKILKSMKSDSGGE